MSKLDKFIDNHAMILKAILLGFCINMWIKIIYSMHICLTIVDIESTPANRQISRGFLPPDVGNPFLNV